MDHGTQVTLTVQNKGQAVHNWDVVNQNGADGKPIKTDPVPGGQSVVERKDGDILNRNWRQRGSGRICLRCGSRGEVCRDG